MTTAVDTSDTTSTTIPPAEAPGWIADVEDYCEHFAQEYVPIDIPDTGSVAEVEAYLAARADAFASAPALDVDAVPKVQGEHGDVDANQAAAEALLVEASSSPPRVTRRVRSEPSSTPTGPWRTPPAWRPWRAPAASRPTPTARRPQPSTCP